MKSRDKQVNSAAVPASCISSSGFFSPFAYFEYTKSRRRQRDGGGEGGEERARGGERERECVCVRV